jgi:hypothetical protein
MSTPLTPSSFDLPANTSLEQTKPRKPLPGWLREPLVHFVVLGAALFAVDQLMVSREDDPHRIVVGPEVDAQAVEIFRQERGREPNEAELRALHQVWLDNEVLYREGLAMDLDRGDDAIRERVIFKALSVVDANVKLPKIDDQGLKTWFEGHREKYDEPVRYDFQEAVLTGDSSEATVRAFVEQLNSGTPGDAQAGLRVFKGRPHSNLLQSYGAEFTKEFEAAPPGIWRAMKTTDGWRAMRLDAVAAAKPADFEVMKGVVLQDWRDALAAEQRTQAVRTLAKKYTIEFTRSGRAPAKQARAND